jgi:endonuclease/exonuclease/phosphatase family metal-dependent hydrolase
MLYISYMIFVRSKLLKIFSTIIIISLFVIIVITVRRIISNEDLYLRDEASSQGEKVLTLITYNIRYNGQTDERLAQISQYLASRNPDIIAIQETYGFKKDGPKWDGFPDRKDTLEFIQKEMQKKGINMYITPGWGKGFRDTSLLSKFPIEGYEEQQAGDLPAKIIKIKFYNIYLRIASIHSLGDACQASKTIINKMNTFSDTVNFIMGDFNTSRGTACYNEFISGKYVSGCDTFKVEKCVDTVNEIEWTPCKYKSEGCNNGPYAIDHILYDKDSNFQVIDAYSDTNMKASDHFPVIVKFKYKESCVPNCLGKQCGSDGCGGSCGSCSGENVCTKGNCVCQANCTNKECGESDGCSGKCTACESGYTCNTNTWKCESGACQKICTSKQCGDDGCGGSCGSCTEGEGCVDNQCQEIEYDIDINGDGKIDMSDLTIILSNWKWEKEPRDDKADINGDESVNMVDVSIILNNWTKKY